MSQPGALSRIVLAVLWFLLGLAMVGVSGWSGWNLWRPILDGHPALMTTMVVTAMLGLMAVFWSVASLIAGGRQDREGDPDHPAFRTNQQIRRRATARIALAVPALLICALAVGTILYAKPLEASPEAVVKMTSSDDVLVSDRLTWYELKDAQRDKDGEEVKPVTGFIFIPGARVDPRAYVNLMRPLAKAGYLVIVVKPAFGLAFPSTEQPARVMALFPTIKQWVVGGHSLGGASAAAFAERHAEVDGLILYGAYSATQLTRALPTVAISGTADGFSTPADIEANKSHLPPKAKYVLIEGGIHSFFGDYGVQPGDGVTTVDRAEAQKIIIAETSALLKAVTPPPKKK